MQLQPGMNAIRLSNSTAWMPDIDCLRIQCLETDGIADPSSPERLNGQSSNGECYDLSGKRITTPVSPGIYVVRGQKIAISSSK